MEIIELKNRVAYLEEKCSFLIKKLEETILLQQEEGFEFKRIDEKRFQKLKETNEALKKDNEFLSRKIIFMSKTISWTITKPIRKMNIKFINKWWQKRQKYNI